VCLEEALLETPLDPSTRHDLYQIVLSIVIKAGEQKHGCSLIIDLNVQPIKIAGQQMEHPIDLKQTQLLSVAKALAKVDGALHIRSDLKLHGFACLLDGRAIQGENRARGARFNSALRFTAEHKDLIVVVVSSDRPVSVLQGGVELSAQCEWESFSTLSSTPPTLKEWLSK
jgi:DNA integrity scanning protein DisA with diadenylate cyclase activity